MEGITAEDSEEYLIPELRGSDWELEYVEVDSDEHPHGMAYGWLVESYSFRNDERNISLTCNVEAYNEQPRGRTYSIFVYVDDEQERLLSCRSRHSWWQEIKWILSTEDINEVIDL
jgi:hypothetical protein